MPDQLTKYRRYYNKLKVSIDENSAYFEARAEKVRGSLEMEIRIGAWEPQEPITTYVKSVAGVVRQSVRIRLYRGTESSRDDLGNIREKIYGRLKEFEQADVTGWNEDDCSACVSFYPSLSLLDYLENGTFDSIHFQAHEKLLTNLYDRSVGSVAYSHTMGGKLGTVFILVHHLLEGDFRFVIEAMQDCPPRTLSQFRPSYPEEQLLKIAYYAALVCDGSASEEDILSLRVLDAGLVAFWMQEKIDHSGGYCILPDVYVVFYRAILAILAGKESDIDSVVAALRPRAILAQFEEVKKLVVNK